MLVTAVTPKGKTKSRVELDYDESLVLSNRDLYAWNIREGQELPDAVCQEIRADLQKTVLAKCGSLLKGGDYTSKGLHDKLVQNGYPEDIASSAVSVMEEAHYIDDRRYAENYLNYHSKDRSLLRIRRDLQSKGIPADLMEEVLSRWEEENGEQEVQQEMEQIRKLMRKRHYDAETASFEDTQKLKSFLRGKGYAIDLIVKAMEQGD